jgi:hypothetical protein
MQNNLIYKNSPYAQEFGISMADKMATINGRYAVVIDLTTSVVEPEP